MNREMDRKTGGARTVVYQRPPLSQQDMEVTIKFGKYKGKRLVDLPTDYLDWIYDQQWPSEQLKFTIKRIRLSQIAIAREAARSSPAPWEE